MDVDSVMQPYFSQFPYHLVHSNVHPLEKDIQQSEYCSQNNFLLICFFSSLC